MWRLATSSRITLLSLYLLVCSAVWFAIILTSFICASLLVNTMWTRFRMSPTMTAVKDTHLPLYSLPFPAVSVCSTDKIKREEAYVYLSKYVNMTNDKVRKGVDYFLNAMALFQHPMYSRMIPFLEKSGKVLKALAAVNLTDFMLQVTPTCDEIFNRCFWIGKSYNCCTLFRQQRTEEGFCYSFNSLTSRHDEYCQAVGNLGSFSEFRHPSDAKACPLRRNTAAGSSSGLEVFLKSFNVSNRITNANDTIGIHGYRVQIFYVAEYPEAGMGSLVESEIGIKLVVTVKPSVTISTEAIRHLDINDRFCYFPDEQSLSISYSYSQKSCLIECRLNHLKKVCRCRPYYFNMLECCKFHDHWVGNWYQSGIRKTISIQGNRFSSKGSCIASDGDKFLIADDERICYRCVVIHEKHYNVLQYKETFCHGRETLNKICALITGEALLYSMFRENATPITCPFKPPYTFTYNRGHGECRYPVSTIDSCTQDSKFVIQYQACPDVYGSESALEEIQCLAVWKEGSYRYLVGKVNNYHIGSGEDHYRCFVFEKSSTFPSISMDSDSTVDREVEYKIAQSGDATCTGLFSPAEGSRTMILKRTPHNFKCKFPNWMTKKKQWHTLDYSYSYTFWQNNNTLSIANTTSLMDENYYLNEKLTRHSLFNGDEIRINCVDAIKSSNDYVQLLTHYLTECQRGYLCITLHKRSDHIAEIQLGAATKRQEDACQRNFFDPSKTAYITLVTPEPETKVCPFFGNFRVNGVSGVEQSVSDRFSSDESRNSQPYLSSVDIMETFSDNLSQNYLRADSQVTHDDAADSQPYSRNSKYTRRRNVKRRDINYVGFQSNAKLNLSTTYVLSPSGSASLAAAPVSTPRGHERARSRSSRRPEAAENGTARVKRSASSGDKKNSCILNFNKLYFGCRSPDTMEFRSDCPLFSSDIISVYLCHGSWIHNVSQNSSVHYLVTTPLSRTSRGVRRYCFMYQTNEDSSLIHFTSTSDTCHRDSVPGADGALSFNITPIGGAGKCAELNSTSVQSSLSWLAAATIVLHCVFTISSRFSLIR